MVQASKEEEDDDDEDDNDNAVLDGLTVVSLASVLIMSFSKS